MAVEQVLFFHHTAECIRKAGILIHDCPAEERQRTAAPAVFFFECPAPGDDVADRDVIYLAVDPGQVCPQSHEKERLQGRDVLLYAEIRHHINIRLPSCQEFMSYADEIRQTKESCLRYGLLKMSLQKKEP